MGGATDVRQDSRAWIGCLGASPERIRMSYGMHADQTFSSLTSFIKNMATFVSLYKFIMKISLTIHLIVAIMHYKY